MQICISLWDIGTRFAKHQCACILSSCKKERKMILYGPAVSSGFQFKSLKNQILNSFFSLSGLYFFHKGVVLGFSKQVLLLQNGSGFKFGCKQMDKNQNGLFKREGLHRRVQKFTLVFLKQSRCMEHHTVLLHLCSVSSIYW